MGLFDFFGKSTLTKVLEELRINDLGAMASLLDSASRHSYGNFTKERKRLECQMLKKNYNLLRGPANESLNRFKWARDICEEHELMDGSRFFENYIDIYNLYIKEYCD